MVADNVGDNVGDIAGMGSDLFGSFAESTCAALVSEAARLPPSKQGTLSNPAAIRTTAFICQPASPASITKQGLLSANLQYLYQLTWHC
jgi:Na+/H+-translocating membrane pyrophosphatase